MKPHRPRKRFGQHFLADPGVIDAIVTAINPQPGDTIVEIGPGQGAITGALARKAGKLHCVELDRDLAASLRGRFGERDNVVIHEADALRFDFCSLGDSLRIVGNLPYNISTPLLFHLIEHRDCIADMHFMLQKEVVDRMAAPPGSRTYGRLSVMAQYRANITPLFDVLPESFTPTPKVRSTIVRLQPLKKPPVDAGTFENLAKVVTAAFSMRRKTLRNSLRAVFSEDQILATGIDPGQRAEQLSLSQFAALARSLPYDTN